MKDFPNIAFYAFLKGSEINPTIKTHPIQRYPKESQLIKSKGNSSLSQLISLDGIPNIIFEIEKYFTKSN